MTFLNSVFVSLHGRAFGLFRGLAAPLDGWLGGDNLQDILVDTADTLTALGTTAATALALTKAANRVTAAAASTGVALPVSKAGMRILVIHDGANAITVYPAVADTAATIDGGASVTLTNARRSLFACTTAGTWFSMGLAKST